MSLLRVGEERVLELKASICYITRNEKVTSHYSR